jgi:predicted outer membrane repeat protein
MTINRKFNLVKKLVLITVLFISIGLQAQTTHTVLNTNDTGTGSFRAAAASAVAGDIIRFNPNLIASGSNSIVLTSGEIAFGSKGVTIKGLYNSTDTLSISGNNSSGILSFFGAGRIVLDSLVLKNGNNSGSGGAISRYNCTDTLFVSNSLITGNTAYSGGGIYSNSSSSSTSSTYSISVTNSTISGNSASNSGGAIYSNAYDYASIIITNSKLSGNSATNDGGAVYCKSTSSDSVSVTNSTISGNTATSGGGIYSLSTAYYNFSSVGVINSTISGNTASFKGAGIYAYSYSGCAVGVTNSTVSGNTAAVDGGGIYSYSSSYYTSAVTVINSTISGNSAATSGGGIFSFSLTGLSIIIASSSIVAENGTNSSGIYNSQTSTIQSAGYNIFSDSPTGINPFDSVNTTSLQLNLQGLAFNGGSTQTRLPGVGSIAIGNGDPNDNSDAQNGPISGRRNIGAAHTCLTVLSTISVSTCSSYTVPSGNSTYTQSGVYVDTLSATCGADSILTINLTINNGTTSTLTETACNSYTSPSGNYVWTSSNTYMDTIPNAANCDSIITINLTIINSTTSTINATACTSYTSPSGAYEWTSSNTYLDTIPNAVNCDSVITVNLTINSTTSTINATACNSYTSPSGNHVWTSSNTYLDTIPNFANCDSIITVNLIINATTSVLNESACVSYTSPSGNHIWTSSNTYMDTIPNSNNCDSIITINLTINYPTNSTITAIACNNYTSPSGNYVWTSSNTYMDTITNAANCDSIITINLTVLNSTTSTMTVTACDSFTSPSGNYVWTSSNTYMDTITNAANCDSIITLILTINNSNQVTDVISDCNPITWIDGNTYSASNNTATHTLLNATGCDSLVTLDFTLLQSSSSTELISSCSPITWIDGITYNQTTNSPVFTIPNSQGCDSVITLDLTILGPDTAVIRNFLTLTAQASNATYQWIDCNNGVITGETSASYTATVNGNYQVEITKNGCVDSSACFAIANVGVQEAELIGVSIYPNPTVEVLNMDKGSNSSLEITITNSAGVRVHQSISKDQITTINMSKMATGIYVVILKNEMGMKIEKVVKR